MFARSVCTPHSQPELCARLTHYGVPVLRLQGDANIKDGISTEYAEMAIEIMRSNIRHPPLWLAFVSGPTGDPERYNTQPTPQGITCTP